MPTDTTEKRLEGLVVSAMTGKMEVTPPKPGETADSEGGFGGAGWILGDAKSYDREYAADLAQLSDFIFGTQKPLIEALDLSTTAQSGEAPRISFVLIIV